MRPVEAAREDPLPLSVDVRHWFCVSADDELAAPGDVRWHALLRSAD